ncbi:hypothetical protein LTR53_013658 [Teratosphaeriaceae sp. CCFEE 6253]|nr:hypothetical protein LTR53_013658 [Teratosphaeriaceae sp. CCFEE 6253]
MQVPAQSQPAPAVSLPPTQDVNSILAMLANAVPKAVVPTPQQSVQQPPPHTQLPQDLPPNIAALFGQQQHQPTFPQPPPAYPAAQPLATPMQMPSNQLPQGFPGFHGYPPQQAPSIAHPYAFAPPPPQPVDPLGPLRGILPPNIINDKDKLVLALNLLQDLQKQGLPMDQWGPILKAFDDAQGPSQPPANGHDMYARHRSRSPEHGSGNRGRASPVYGTYDETAGRKPVEDERMNRSNGGGGRGRYRQRSPMRDIPMRDSPIPIPVMNGHGLQPKYVAIDNSLPPNHIKVLSRTLFVGGANGSQPEIQAVFERFGKVQTCIANREKRHAFVKMTTRQYALAAKRGMEELQERNEREVLSVARQTKWGVGFGPRECCDYTTGESVVPLSKLTDADVKWAMTAEYGGTGGQPLEGGMVIEEPDIEIGAGVSSKAMSRRVLPAADVVQQQQQQQGSAGKRQREGKGGHQQPKKRQQHDYDREPAGYASAGYSGVTGGPPPPQQYQPHQQKQQQPPAMESYGYGYDRLPQRPEPMPVAVAAPPAVPTFGFSLPGFPGAGYR